LAELELGAALLLGLFGSSHCLAMCGGFSAALGMGTDATSRFRLVLLFQIGRIAGYTLLGAGLGSLLGSIDLFPGLLRIFSGLLLVSMGLYLANWWKGLMWLERLGQVLWRRIQPLSQRLLPLRRKRDAILVGLYWGFLPCGLIYTALAWSATSAGAIDSALLMFCFGLGTVPVMFATGLAGEQLAAALRRRDLRSLMAAVLIGFGVWTAAVPLAHQLSPEGHLHHQEQKQKQQD
jgi:sulfite exporter TauE/SafE